MLRSKILFASLISLVFAHSEGIKPTSFDDETFYEAIKATTTITFGGNLAILAFTYFDISATFLKRMVSFAIGGLLGDVFLHLIPHAIMSELASASNHHHHHHHDNEGHTHEHHNHDEHEEHMHNHDVFNNVGLYVLLGIFLFFAIEKVMQAINPGGHSHSHTVSPSSKSKEAQPQSLSQILKPTVLLNLMGDFVHNFTDGLALAAAFQVDKKMGHTMTIAVTLHEIPHEFGDFAVLVNNGLSKKTAFLLQFVSALGAYAGCVVGMLYTVEHPAVILSIAAGGFIYIATTSLLVDLVSLDTSLLETLLHLVFMGIGVYSMLLIGEFEESVEHSH